MDISSTTTVSFKNAENSICNSCGAAKDGVFKYSVSSARRRKHGERGGGGVTTRLVEDITLDTLINGGALKKILTGILK